MKKADGTPEEMTADAIIISTGSVNATASYPRHQGKSQLHRFHRGLSLEKLPESMVVIGGGVIGLELACAYASFGTKITVVEAMDHMTFSFDP